MLEIVSQSASPLATTVSAAVIMIMFYCLLTCLYNLYLHPLRKFPGPKLAAMGSLYEFYYDVVKDGTYLWEMERMHRVYGPVVRVNPRELHIHDPQYYSNIYAAGRRKVNKDGPSVRAFAAPNAIAATVDHETYRKRRGYLSSYFSKRFVVGHEPVIHERIGRLCGRMEEYMRSGRSLGLDAAFSALTSDIVTHQCYGEHFDYLGNADFNFAVREAFLGISLIYHLARLIPGLATFLKSLPYPIIRLMSPAAADLLEVQAETKRKILLSLNRQIQSPKPVVTDDKYVDPDSNRAAEPKSVIAGMLVDPNIPSKEKTMERLLDEALLIIFGGTETTSRSLAVALFYLLHDKSHLQKLRVELATLPYKADHAYTLSQLEPLPYLTGVVNECIRLSFGPISRLPRIATHEALQYKDYVIPPGTPVSQSTYFVQTNESVFPDPFKFDPERWIRAAQEGSPLNRYLVSFTKGSRQCIGITMAYAELYLTISRIALTFEMDLHDTTLEDLGIHHVRIIGYPKKIKGQAVGRGEIYIKVTGKVDAKREKVVVQ